MSTSILNVTFDCADAASTARFWSDVTTWRCAKEDVPGNPHWVVGPSPHGGLRLVFVDVPEAKTVKNHVHLDFLSDHGAQDQEIERMVSLGARIIDDRRHATPAGWVAMADTEGNEFDVEAGG